MPFDPTKPAFGSPDSSAEMRAQFNGLKELIDAASGVTSAVVDSVTTLDPSEAATVSLSVVGTVLHVSLGLPRGADGLTGPPGPQGTQGTQGPPFAAAIVDGVTTLDPGMNASVTAFFDGNNVHFTFGIPRGLQGEQGIQGPPGEVSTAALSAAVADTLTSATANSSANTNSVPTLDTPFADPDTEALRQAFNALVLALRR